MATVFPNKTNLTAVQLYSEIKHQLALYARIKDDPREGVHCHSAYS